MAVAAAAESLTGIESPGMASGNLWLVPQPPEEVATQFVLADNVPELRWLRLVARRNAQQTLDTNMQTLRDGDFEAVIPEVDALGTARAVAEAEESHGKESAEYQLRFEGLALDCERLYGEAYRLLTWEVFDEVEQVFDSEAGNRGEFFSHGFSITGLTENGLSPIADAQEKPLRIDDRVEEETYVGIAGFILDEVVEVDYVDDGMNVLTVLQCPDYIIEAYKRNPEKFGRGTYVPEIEKIMWRNIRFDMASGRRFEQQIATSGLYHTNEVINEAFQIMEVFQDGRPRSKDEIHSAQVLVRGEFDPLEMIELCDILASQKTGKNIFMGEEVPAEHPKDYAAVRTEAAERRQEVQGLARQLAHKLVDMQKRGVDKWDAPKIVENIVQKDLLKLIENDPEKAEAIFDKKTADGVRETMRLRASGNHREADDVWARVAAAAPKVGFCGAGPGSSCGLESVEQNSIEGWKAISLGLNAASPDELVRITDQECSECHDTTKIYMDSSYNKACVGCGNTNIKVGEKKLQKKEDKKGGFTWAA